MPNVQPDWGPEPSFPDQKLRQFADILPDEATDAADTVAAPHAAVLPALAENIRQGTVLALLCDVCVPWIVVRDAGKNCWPVRQPEPIHRAFAWPTAHGCSFVPQIGGP